MFRGTRAVMCRLTDDKEQLKQLVKPVVERFGRMFERRDLAISQTRWKAALFRRRELFLRSFARKMQTDTIQAGVAKARWMPQMISAQARVVYKVPDDGFYHVILIRRGETVVVVDLLCCLFLNAMWDFDLCFLDVHQVRTILIEGDLIFPNSKVQESKQILTEKLLADADFRAFTEQALQDEEVMDAQSKNLDGGRPEMLSTCSMISAFLNVNWSTALKKKYRVKHVHGEWNECAVSRWFADTERKGGFSHDWIQIQDVLTLESVEFDPAFSQFIDSNFDSSLRSFFADVGQLRSVGLTQKEREKKGYENFR